MNEPPNFDLAEDKTDTYFFAGMAGSADAADLGSVTLRYLSGDFYLTKSRKSCIILL